MADFLPMRNALIDWAHVQSEEMFAGDAAHERPLLTIAIPTYRRHDLLHEAVRSALEQDLDQPFEVVVVDNDPASNGHELLLAALPQALRANFRYLRNRENLGMYGNTNRCVEVAKGEWLSILHDDDLLDPSFAREMLGELAADPRIDGIVCQKRGLDHRETPFRESGLKSFARRGLETYRFHGGSVRRISGRKLFWGCITGNTVGFICRTRDAKAIGGFYPEEHPSCDYFFYARFAERFRLVESRKVLGTIRIAVNTLMGKETQITCLQRGFELQQAYAGSVLPKFWRRLSPLLMARQLSNTVAVWRSDLSRQELGARLGIRVPRDRPLILFAIRAVLRGF